MKPLLSWQQVAVQYPNCDQQSLRDLQIDLPAGELALILGRTGSGKTTLLRTINGSVPHSTGGTLTGRVLTAGRDTRTHRPRDLADVVALVPQRPADAFIADTVEAELAYGMECLGLAQSVMRRRVEETLDLLGLHEVRSRPVTRLSAGQQQRVAIAAALVVQPQILALDEPTSALDPAAAEEVLSAIHRLVHDTGTTVLLSEHRLERVVQFADVALSVAQGQVQFGPVDFILGAQPAHCALLPPVVALAQLLGWSPTPLSIRDARRLAASDLRLGDLPDPPTRQSAGALVAHCHNLVAHYGPIQALRGVQLSIHAGQVTALMGRNGAGKTTLIHALAGLHQPSSGQVRVAGLDPARMPRKQAADLIAVVPADPGDLLLSDRVDRELAQADRQADAVSGTCSQLLDRLLPDIPRQAHPRYLSSGQRLALAVATCLPRKPQLLLLDEPTRGLDYPAKTQISAMLRELAASGLAVVVVTHDVELAADIADEVVIMAEGEVVAAGPARSVLTDSPAFAPQVAKILPSRTVPFLTVAEVHQALAVQAS